MSNPIILPRSSLATFKISVHQQRWLRTISGAILIPPALLVVADSSIDIVFSEI